MTHDHDHDHSCSQPHSHGHSHEGHSHEHGHSHEGHSHDHGHSHGSEMTLEQKLATLLTHWIDHNDSHKDNFISWAEKAKQGGMTEVASCLEQAGSLSREVTKKLEAALKAISG